MNVLHRLSCIALVALIASACAEQSPTNESSGNDLSKSTPLFSVAGTPIVIDFEPTGSEPYVIGKIHLQHDWLSSGPYDHFVVANALATPPYSYPTFGDQSLRISNAVTSGSFGDQTFSKRTTNSAGETASDCGTPTWCVTGGSQNHFEAEWQFASTVPGAEQPGLSVVASPDRGDGSRMSWVQMTDTPTGLAINFFDVRGKSDPSNFVGPTKVATGLSRTVPHRIKITMDLFEGPSNDIVKVYVDDALKHTGTSWENYYRYDSEQFANGNKVPIVNRILFRTSGTAAPATAGFGFVIDSLNLATSAVPGSQDACKNGGWQTLTRPDGSGFKSQGDCSKYVSTGT